MSLCGAAAYAAIIVGRAQGIAMDEVAYVVPMLSSVGAAIAAGILGNIAVAIGNPKEAGKKDARDREIQAFGVNVGQSFLVIGGSSRSRSTKCSSTRTPESPHHLLTAPSRPRAEPCPRVAQGGRS